VHAVHGPLDFEVMINSDCYTELGLMPFFRELREGEKMYGDLRQNIATAHKGNFSITAPEEIFSKQMIM
jgi:hypothetical protein